jgi:hypothetical protein
MTAAPTTFYQFPTAQDARDYRHVNGTGGWIFAQDSTGQATLFPPHMSPSHIFNHPLVAGQTGRLIGSA